MSAQVQVTVDQILARVGSLQMECDALRTMVAERDQKIEEMEAALAVQAGPKGHSRGRKPFQPGDAARLMEAQTATLVNGTGGL